MGVTKRIICLANSRKNHGRCVAGRVVGSGTEWVRPVSDRPTEEVSEYERQYPDGSDPRVLDVIDVPLLKPHPKSYQQENWLLDADEYWLRAGDADWNRVKAFSENPESLWANGNHTYWGLNNRMSLDVASTHRTSLVLIHVKQLRLRVFPPNQKFGDAKRRVQAQFTHRGTGYRLRVTDPGYEKEYLKLADDLYDVGESLLTVSLGEPYEGHVYKLVAAIIERARTEGHAR